MITSIIDFKNPERFEREFWLLHPIVQEILYFCGYYAKKHAGSILMVTCLVRAPQENARVGGRKQSAHIYGRAADLRVWNIPDKIANRMIRQVRIKYGKKVHILIHGGTARHIHVNVNYAYAEKFRKVVYDAVR